jgi:hypothetical protein
VDDQQGVPGRIATGADAGDQQVPGAALGLIAPVSISSKASTSSASAASTGPASCKRERSAL